MSTVSEKKKEDWMNSKWRPMMGWMYMLVCMMDFVGFPILWSLLQALHGGTVTSQWQPLTLQGAGLFHIAMGAVIGISAYGRTQEKLNGAETGGMQFPAGAGTTYVPGSANTNANINVSAPAATAPAAFSTPHPAAAPAAPAATGGFGSGFNTGATPATTTGFGGKPAPAPQVDPEI